MLCVLCVLCVVCRVVRHQVGGHWLREGFRVPGARVVAGGPLEGHYRALGALLQRPLRFVLAAATRELASFLILGVAGRVVGRVVGRVWNPQCAARAMRIRMGAPSILVARPSMATT